MTSYQVETLLGAGEKKMAWTQTLDKNQTTGTHTETLEAICATFRSSRSGHKHSQIIAKRYTKMCI